MFIAATAVITVAATAAVIVAAAVQFRVQ